MEVHYATAQTITNNVNNQLICPTARLSITPQTQMATLRAEPWALFALKTLRRVGSGWAAPATPAGSRVSPPEPGVLRPGQRNALDPRFGKHPLGSSHFNFAVPVPSCGVRVFPCGWERSRPAAPSLRPASPRPSQPHGPEGAALFLHPPEQSGPYVLLKTPPRQLPSRRQNCCEKNTQVICESELCVWQRRSSSVGPRKAMQRPKLKKTLQ